MRYLIVIILAIGLNFSNSYSQILEELEEDKSEVYNPNEVVYGAHPEIGPQFPGGVDSLFAFLFRNLEYPMHTNCKDERIFVLFTVDSIGIISDIEVKRGECQAFIEEAIRVFSIMPWWIPGTYNGHAIKMRYTFPVSFRKV